MRWEDTVLRPGGVEVPAGKEDAPAAQEKSGEKGLSYFLGLMISPADPLIGSPIAIHI